MRFTPEGGVRVEIDPAAENGDLAITIRDTGPGIEVADRERIFEPFVQASRDPKSRAAGTGLGLAVARELTERLGGTLTLETTPGVGSAFTVRLPAH